MATPSVTWQDKFSTTLTSGITASDTTIPLNALPTGSEGYLVIEPDSSTAWEVIYYTSKTGSGVVCPSAAAGRGLSGSTAASHSSGATVRMDTTAQMFNALQDGTGLVGLHTNNTDSQFDYVVSGCVWSGDAYASTRAASMTSGVVRINGRRFTVSSVTARTFTASKDTYVDVLYSTTDNTGTLVYTEVTNNAASPALASNSIRLAIIVTGASNIADVGSINQGQENKVLPIASSIAYSVTDSLGNLICPRDPNRRVLGYRQFLTDFTNSALNTFTDITGLNTTVNIPANRKVKVTVGQYYVTSSAGTATFVEQYIIDSTASLGIAGTGANTAGVSYASDPALSTIYTPPASGSRTFKAQFRQNGAGTYKMAATTTAPSFILVELV